MARPTGIIKKTSYYFSDSKFDRDYIAISKAAWADLYFDLYNQVFGSTSPEEVMQDAVKRLNTLKVNGIR